MPFVLKSLNEHPPGGFQYRESATGMLINEPGFSFINMVTAIHSHRKNNPNFKLSLDPYEISWTLEDYTCTRLQNAPQWCLEVTDEQFAERRTKPPPGAGCGGGCP